MSRPPVTAPEERPLNTLTIEERLQRQAQNMVVPMRDFRALVAALIARGIITAEDVERAKEARV